MKRGISLHPGLNYANPKTYEGWDGEFYACGAGAMDMAASAKSRRFKSEILLWKQVTTKAVKNAIIKATKILKEGDIFALTYPGHGGQVPDWNGDEDRFGDAGDGKDESWCPYERDLIDGEIFSLHAQFKPGVRILVIYDSCHSDSTNCREDERRTAGCVRLLPPEKSLFAYEKNKPLNDAALVGVLGTEEQKIRASVILISGCQNKQFSQDDVRRGAFKGERVELRGDGISTRVQKNFRDLISAEMSNPEQMPNYFVIGSPILGFENQTLFVAPKRAGAKAVLVLKTRRPAHQDLVKAETPPELVLNVLRNYGYAASKPSSSLPRWFQRKAKEAEASAVPPPGRLGLMAAILNQRLRVGMTPSKMRDRYNTSPQDIVDLV